MPQKAHVCGDPEAHSTVSPSICPLPSPFAGSGRRADASEWMSTSFSSTPIETSSESLLAVRSSAVGPWYAFRGGVRVCEAQTAAAPCRTAQASQAPNGTCSPTSRVNAMLPNQNVQTVHPKKKRGCRRARSVRRCTRTSSGGVAMASRAAWIGPRAAMLPISGSSNTGRAPSNPACTAPLNCGKRILSSQSARTLSHACGEQVKTPTMTSSQAEASDKCVLRPWRSINSQQQNVGS